MKKRDYTNILRKNEYPCALVHDDLRGLCPLRMCLQNATESINCQIFCQHACPIVNANEVCAGALIACESDQTREESIDIL